MIWTPRMVWTMYDHVAKFKKIIIFKVMILITDGFQSTNTTLMFQMIDQAKAEGVRLIALGFFGDFAFYSPNLYLMTNEVYHAANYAELLAIDNTIFETICSDGVIPDGVAAGESASDFEKTV